MVPSFSMLPCLPDCYATLFTASLSAGPVAAANAISPVECTDKSNISDNSLCDYQLLSFALTALALSGHLLRKCSGLSNLQVMVF